MKKTRKWFIMTVLKDEIMFPVTYPGENGESVVMTFPNKESAEKLISATKDMPEIVRAVAFSILV